jgi:hypothetical protein
LEKVDVSKVAVVDALAVFPHQIIIVGQLRRCTGTHVRENYSAELPHRITLEFDFVFKIASGRLSRLLYTLTVDVINPAMIAAAQSAAFDPPVFERRVSVCTEGMDQSDATKLVAKDNQILAEPSHESRLIGCYVLRESNRYPILP